MKNNKKIIITISILFILVSIYYIVAQKKNYTIFSIPVNTTPKILESKGFQISRNRNFLGEIDEDHKGEVEFCNLELGDCLVRISFRLDDSTKIGSQIIKIDYATFEQMTNLKPKKYKSVKIDGENYKVTADFIDHHLILERLGLDE